MAKETAEDMSKINQQIEAMTKLLDQSIGPEKNTSEIKKRMSAMSMLASQRASIYGAFGMPDPGGQAISQLINNEMNMGMFDIQQQNNRNELKVHLTKLIFDAEIAKTGLELEKKLKEAQMDKLADEKRLAGKEDSRKDEELQLRKNESIAQVENLTASKNHLNALSASIATDIGQKLLTFPDTVRKLHADIDAVRSGIDVDKANIDAVQASTADMIEKTKVFVENIKQSKSIYDGFKARGLPDDEAAVATNSILARAEKGEQVSMGETMLNRDALNKTGLSIPDQFEAQTRLAEFGSQPITTVDAEGNQTQEMNMGVPTMEEALRSRGVPFTPPMAMPMRRQQQQAAGQLLSPAAQYPDRGGGPITRKMGPQYDVPGFDSQEVMNLQDMMQFYQNPSELQDW